jgi:hypothetical protein
MGERLSSLETCVCNLHNLRRHVRIASTFDLMLAKRDLLARLVLCGSARRAQVGELDRRRETIKLIQWTRVFSAEERTSPVSTI